MTDLYVCSLFRRANAASGAPTFTEVAEVQPVGGISFEDVLNAEGEASISVDPYKLRSEIKSYIVDLRDTPLELRITKGSTTKFRGPLISCQQQGPTLTLNSRGAMYYWRYWFVESDLYYQNTDIFTIIKGLIDHYQALAYGNYGFDTSGMGTSGTTTTRNFLFAEGHNIFDRIEEMSQRVNGFDYWIDPDTREVNIASSRGTDKSNTVFLEEGVDDPNVFWSVASGDIASEAIAAGTSDAGRLVVGTASDTPTREAFGRSTYFETIDGVGEQTTIDNYASRFASQRTEQIMKPGPSVLPVADADIDSFAPGDTVSYSVDFGLGKMNFARRVLKKRVTVDETGQESMDVELE